MFRKYLSKFIIPFLLSGILTISDYRLYQIYRDYAAEKAIRDMAMKYKPEDNVPSDGEPKEEIINQNIIDLQAEYPDAAGWLIIDETNMDYPFFGTAIMLFICGGIWKRNMQPPERFS